MYLLTTYIAFYASFLESRKLFVGLHPVGLLLLGFIDQLSPVYTGILWSTIADQWLYWLSEMLYAPHAYGYFQRGEKALSDYFSTAASHQISIGAPMYAHTPSKPGANHHRYVALPLPDYLSAMCIFDSLTLEYSETFGRSVQTYYFNQRLSLQIYK